MTVIYKIILTLIYTHFNVILRHLFCKIRTFVLKYTDTNVIIPI